MQFYHETVEIGALNIKKHRQERPVGAILKARMTLRIKVVRNSWVAKRLLASQEGLSSTELVRMTY
jgi:hypothetical protein